MSDGSVVVAEGRWQTQEPKALVNGLPLGPKAVKVFLDLVHEYGTFLWRPTLDMAYLEDCLQSFISWPVSKVVFENPAEPTTQKSSSPSGSNSPPEVIVSKKGKSRATTSTSPTVKAPPSDQVRYDI